MGETSTTIESVTRGTAIGNTKKLEPTTTETGEPLETSHSGKIMRMRPVRISGSANITVRVNVNQIQRQRSIEETNAEIHRRSRG